MANDLIGPTDLAHLPGAPFDEFEVDEAVASLRGELGWHIAPEREETGVTLDVAPCDPVLRLPSRYVISVEEIRNTATDAVIASTTYKISKALGRVRRSYAWPSGYGAVEVDFTHGYEKCPPELRPIIASRIVQSRTTERVTQESVGPFSRSFATDGGVTSDTVERTLARFNARPSWPAAV